jgi:hypothetical protein
METASVKVNIFWKILLQTSGADPTKCLHSTGNARMAELVDALD